MVILCCVDRKSRIESNLCGSPCRVSCSRRFAIYDQRKHILHIKSAHMSHMCAYIYIIFICIIYWYMEISVDKAHSISYVCKKLERENIQMSPPPLQNKSAVTFPPRSWGLGIPHEQAPNMQSSITLHNGIHALKTCMFGTILFAHSMSIWIYNIYLCKSVAAVCSLKHHFSPRGYCYDLCRIISFVLVQPQWAHRCLQDADIAFGPCVSHHNGTQWGNVLGLGQSSIYWRHM